MLHTVITIGSVAAGILAVSGCVYYVLCIFAVRAFRRSIAGSDGAALAWNVAAMPPVSILKPLRGVDRGLYEALRTHCAQDYADYEIIFGVSDRDDPAVDLVERLKREFPERRLKLVFCTQTLGTNIKVSNLAQMLPSAQNHYLIVNDSDISVPADYIWKVTASLQADAIGMTTALYRGAAGRTFWSKLEALGISTDFASGVLTARMLESGIRFGLGSTLALKRDALNAIGGFETLLDYLGDDYELGKRIADAAYRVELAPVVVDTLVPEYNLREYWNHQIRWMRTVRASRAGGYAGLVFTLGLPFALAALLLRPAWWSALLFAVTVLLRYVVAWQVAVRAVKDLAIVRHLWLIPVRDVLALPIWVAGFMSNHVVWRGHKFQVKNGKLERAT